MPAWQTEERQAQVQSSAGEMDNLPLAGNQDKAPSRPRARLEWKGIS